MKRLLKAKLSKSLLHTSLTQSIFIGDKVSDIKAAENAGIDNRILVDGKYLIYSYARSNYAYGDPVYNYEPGIKLYDINKNTV